MNIAKKLEHKIGLRSVYTELGFLCLVFLVELQALAGVLAVPREAGFPSLMFLISAVLMFGAAFVMLIVADNKLASIEVIITKSVSKRPFYFVLQFCAALVLIPLTNFVADMAMGAELNYALILLWLFALLALPVFAARVLLSWAQWLQLLRISVAPLFVAFIFVVLVRVWETGAQEMWVPLSETTLRACAWLLNQIYDVIHYDIELKALGANGFVVRIDTLCSGFEGMALITGFSTFYLYLFRKNLRFPQALLLIPAGLVAAWILNVIRIVTLIAIGIEWSPEVAVGGFHSNAGVLLFVLLSFILLGISHRYLHKKDLVSSGTLRNSVAATLVPFIALLGMTLLTPAFSADFDWFYPLRVVVVGAVIAWYWQFYSFSSWRPGVFPVLAGLAVAVIWVVIYPPSGEYNADFDAQLASVSTEAQYAWLLMRTLGSVLTVPIAEELLFRGYLFTKLGPSGGPAAAGSFKAHGFVILISAVLFGILHDAWVAGTIAGIIYGLVRVRTGKVLDAVLAHATTNACITIYVLQSGNWAMW